MIKSVEKDLFITIKSKTESIPIMDEFERIDDKAEALYDRLIIMDAVNGYGRYIDLVVERKKSRFGIDGVTFTNIIRRNAWPLYKYVEDEIEKIVVEDYIDAEQIVYFKDPFIFKAATSLDRTGYGSKWEHSGKESYLIYEGAKYGQTTEYLIMGILLYSNPYWQRIDI